MTSFHNEAAALPDGEVVAPQPVLHEEGDHRRGERQQEAHGAGGMTNAYVYGSADDRQHRGDGAEDQLHPEDPAHEMAALLGRGAQRAQRDHGRGDEAELHAVGEQQNSVGDGESAELNQPQAAHQDDAGDEIRSAYERLVEDGERTAAAAELQQACDALIQCRQSSRCVRARRRGCGALCMC